MHAQSGDYSDGAVMRRGVQQVIAHSALEQLQRQRRREVSSRAAHFISILVSRDIKQEEAAVRPQV